VICNLGVSLLYSLLSYLSCLEGFAFCYNVPQGGLGDGRGCEPMLYLRADGGALTVV